MYRPHPLHLISLAMLALGISAPCLPASPDFNREVRPILSNHCFQCHGPDEETREAGLRLDLRDSAIDTSFSAIVPGDPDSSLLLERIHAPNASDVMPPPSANKPLSDAQREILHRWIEAGAPYDPHWAFEPPTPHAPPTSISEEPAPPHPIDAFVHQRLAAENLHPSAPADPHILARRAALDLTGLPPTPEQLSRFTDDPSHEGYLTYIDSLLDSPRYGEHWARQWLDLARYADTNGYEKDRSRSIWPWRDWVVDALNADMPYDEFSITQLAGDLLPDASLQQKIATGFHRNTMINEEGGIDPLEFRYHAIVDRVHTTATTWLGLTISCAQCHTHKYDPITHREYFQLYAFLDQAEEPILELPDPAIDQARENHAEQILSFIAKLPDEFPIPDAHSWIQPSDLAASSAHGDVTLEPADDASLMASGASPDTDTYTLTFTTPPGTFDRLRLEALTHQSLGNSGPGRTLHGNFVLSHVDLELVPSPDPANPSQPPDPPPKPILASASADFSPDNFPVSDALDPSPRKGWGVAGQGNWNADRTAVFLFDQPANLPHGATWTLTLSQEYGGGHTLGRFRVSPGNIADDPRPEPERRADALASAFGSWLDQASQTALPWQPLQVISATSEVPVLTVENDGQTIYASSDQTKEDTYSLSLRLPPGQPPLTAIRLEALADPRLPSNGPGRAYYEGPSGDFHLANITAAQGDRPLPFSSAHQSFANGNNSAAKAIDDDLQSGWGISGGQGSDHQAVFVFASPSTSPVDPLELELYFARHFAAGLGKLRLSATSQPVDPAHVARPAHIETLLVNYRSATDSLSQADRQTLLDYFLAHEAPGLGDRQQELRNLRGNIPSGTTTLVMAPRTEAPPRTTRIHHRGEYTQPSDPVIPGVPTVLHPLPEGAQPDRLSFARWLVDPANPLVARVTVNRHWSNFFGTGLVATEDDFGYQGEMPSHPELLDWLALEFVRQGWSLKALHRLIVTSDTYRQDSAISPQALESDPTNRLLARGPRLRLSGESLRDSALHVSGLLSEKQGGPGVFPPQPANITSEGAYGRLAWNPSAGEDRYRRSLYTFAKRTAPFAMYSTFDAPSGEACVARRDSSNTPLQALTLLNDPMLLEAAQALGHTFATRHNATPDQLPDLIRSLFIQILSRPPDADESALLTNFLESQLSRFSEGGGLDPMPLATPPPGTPIPSPSDHHAAASQAAWTTLARAILNLDEAIVRR